MGRILESVDSWGSPSRRLEFSLGKGAALPASDSSPNQKHDDRPNGRTDETSTLACLIPAESLAQIRGDECANNPQNCAKLERLASSARGRIECHREAEAL